MLYPVRSSYLPRALGGLVGDYRMGPAGMFQSAGGAAVAADTDPCGVWRDVSAAGMDLLQVTSTKRPLYRTNKINGRPALVFDGVDDFLQASVGSLGRQATVLVVGAQLTWTSAHRWWDGGSGGGNFLFEQSGSSPQVVGFSGGTGTVGGSLALNTNAIVCVRFDGLRSALFINGAMVSTFPSSWNGNATTGWTLGASGAGTFPGNIQIGRALVWCNPKSDRDIYRVSKWLSDHESWGLM